MTKRNVTNFNQLYLPFGEKSSRALSLEDRQKAFWFLVSVSVFSLFIYVYAINAAAHHIAVRQNLEREVAQMESHLSSLEFASIELKNSITIETAREYGFAEVKEPLYVSRNTLNSLTLNTVTR